MTGFYHGIMQLLARAVCVVSQTKHSSVYSDDDDGLRCKRASMQQYTPEHGLEQPDQLDSQQSEFADQR